jgi:hypothetical protein
LNVAIDFCSSDTISVWMALACFIGYQPFTAKMHEVLRRKW